MIALKRIGKIDESPVNGISRPTNSNDKASLGKFLSNMIGGFAQRLKDAANTNRDTAKTNLRMIEGGLVSSDDTMEQSPKKVSAVKPPQEPIVWDGISRDDTWKPDPEEGY